MGGCPRGVMVKAMDFGIVVCEFKLQSFYYVHFRANTLGKGMKPLILSAMGQIAPLLFFFENGFGIKWPTKVDMPLNKETKPIRICQQNKEIMTHFGMFLGHGIYILAILPEHVVWLFVVNLRHSNIAPSLFASLWAYIDQCIIDISFLLFLCDMFSVLRGTVRGL